MSGTPTSDKLNNAKKDLVDWDVDAHRVALIDNAGALVTVTGGKLDVNASVSMSGVSTEAKQDTQLTALASLLTELQAKTEPQDAQVSELTVAIRRLIMALQNPPYLDKSANAIRNQVQSGTITTVTTCATVTNMSQIDTMQGRLLVMGQNQSAWAQCCRARIS